MQTVNVFDVVGLTFNDYDVLSYVFASSGDDQLPAAAAAAGDDVTAAAAAASPSKYGLSEEAWQVAGDVGPTLTQLNSDDLDSALLDEFCVVASTSSSGFCLDMSSLDCSQLVAAVVSNSTSVPAAPAPAATATAVLLGWSQPRRPVHNVSCLLLRILAVCE